MVLGLTPTRDHSAAVDPSSRNLPFHSLQVLERQGIPGWEVLDRKLQPFHRILQVLSKASERLNGNIDNKACLKTLHVYAALLKIRSWQSHFRPMEGKSLVRHLARLMLLSALQPKWFAGFDGQTIPRLAGFHIRNDPVLRHPLRPTKLPLQYLKDNWWPS